MTENVRIRPEVKAFRPAFMCQTYLPSMNGSLLLFICTYQGYRNVDRHLTVRAPC